MFPGLARGYIGVTEKREIGRRSFTPSTRITTAYSTVTSGYPISQVRKYLERPDFAESLS
jgi:hypothetical protein